VKCNSFRFAPYLSALLALGCGGSVSGTADVPDGTDTTPHDNEAVADSLHEDRGTGDAGLPPGVFRVAVLSDPTIIGDDFHGWNARLEEAVAWINARNDLTLVLVLGDLAAHMVDPYQANPSEASWEDGIQAFVSIMGTLDIPWYAIPGDKDYAEEITEREYWIEWADPTARRSALKTWLGDAHPGDKPWWTFSHGGVRFVGLDTMAGPRALESFGATGSLGEDQLSALEEEFEGEEPLLLLGHHRPEMTLEEGIEGLPARIGMYSDKILAVFSGHLWSYTEYDVGGVIGFGFDTVAVPEPGSPNIAIAEIDVPARTVTIVNRDALPYSQNPGPLDCKPGTDTVGLITLADSCHGVWFTDLNVDDPTLEDLFAAADMGETPFAFHVIADNNNGSLEIAGTMATNVEKVFFTDPAPPDHALEQSWGSPCEVFQWSMDDPCLGATVTITYDLLNLIQPDEFGANCGLYWDYTADLTFGARLGPDADGNLTLADAELRISFVKEEVLDSIKDFMVRTYCANDTCRGVRLHPYMPQEGCSPSENDHYMDCVQGILAFDDVPAHCDPLLGATTDVPLRLILQFKDMLPDEATFVFRGWGHRLTPMDEPSEDWSISTGTFDPFMCM